MIERELESGLWIAEEPQPPPPPPVPATMICAYCDRPSTEPIRSVLFGYQTGDGFLIHWPTCGHGKYILCPKCPYKGCPVCGSGEEYT